MKKLFAIVLALVLCVGLLSIGVAAADYSYVTVTGTMNGWDPTSEADRMTKVSDGVYTITYSSMPAGSYEFKFTANGNWSDLDLGGAYMGSGVESSLTWAGANIKFTLDQAETVKIDLDINNYKFTLTIGGEVAEAPDDITIHVTVPEDWGDIYGYVWTPDSLGSWPGTLAEDGTFVLPAVFAGFLVHNNNGRQTADITDIDLTKSEVWVTVYADNSYTLSYEAPTGGDPIVPEPVANIKINVIAEHWTAVYAYTFNPVSCGSWPGTLLENGMVEVPANFEGLVLTNGEGEQTADIKDIDLTKAEVWITVNADNTYTLSYEAPVVDPGTDPVGPTTGDAILPGVLVLLLSVTGLVMLTNKKHD